MFSTKRLISPALIALGFLILLLTWGAATPDIDPSRSALRNPSAADAVLRGVSGGGGGEIPVSVPAPDPVEVDVEATADDDAAAAAEVEATDEELAFTGTESTLLAVQVGLALLLILGGFALSNHSLRFQRSVARHLASR